MVSQYLESARTGLSLFFGVGLAVLIPLVVVHYVRFGRVEPRRAVALYAFIAYALVVVALVFLPFPDPDAVCEELDQTVSSVPFQWVADMRANLAHNNRSGPFAVLTAPAFLSFAFNTALFVPLGVAMHRVLRKGFITTVMTGFAVSLLFEVTQYTGNFGMYDCPYRIFDVDDLISNTTGSLVGWVIAPLALVVPKVLPVERSGALPDAASLPRRGLAVLMDLALFALAAKLLPDNPLVEVATLLLIRVALRPGQLLLGFRVRAADSSSAGPVRPVVRELLGVTGFWAYVLLPMPRGDVWTLDVVVVLYVVIGLVAVPALRRDQRGWHELVSRTRTVLTGVPGTPPAAEREDEVRMHEGPVA
ncbi:VanZ family protein [Umezawaea beigongshangensis]|uniref:VanZ family protein n=1 Tax=Umezawaea beigongshangensis TaxID=2780383 RepID=UPI0018F121F9|nr:VanZ family protein [Umezawaea beigongshangensis]